MNLLEYEGWPMNRRKRGEEERTPSVAVKSKNAQSKYCLMWLFAGVFLSDGTLQDLLPYSRWNNNQKSCS